ncbi:13165_t:CDS:2 [Funneliformis geosporum]|uniref:13165_t:CDS:1 n=1 Tax=Funneliformis geosporum TaxID=1117311 RepID=A0A9W4SZC5_9GLOM|nr:13165_t:CDS:2 [Funneliformis geosporum]
MKDVQTYQYYKNSMRIQSTYKVQLEENNIHIEIGENTGKYTTYGNLSTNVITKLKDFLVRNINSFATTIQEFIYSDQYEHCIFTEEIPSVALKSYRILSKDDQYIQQEIKISTNDEAIDNALLNRLIILIDKLELNKQDALDNMNQTQE